MFRQLTSRFGKKKGGKNGKKGRGRGGRDKRKRRRKRRNQYRDDTLFDRVVDDLPDPQSGGRMFLLVSFALQALIVTFAFIGYHHKRSGRCEDVAGLGVWVGWCVGARHSADG